MFDKIDKGYLDLVKDQWKIKLEYAKTKSALDLKPLMLDLEKVPAFFEKVKTLLSSLQGSSRTLL